MTRFNRKAFMKKASADDRLPRMRDMRRCGLSNVEIGRAFGVSRERVRQIIGNAPPRKTLVGRRFDHLVVVEEVVRNGRRACVCRCDCGEDGVVRNLNSLRDPHTISSCGHRFFGETASHVKLSDADVRALREECASGERGVVARTARKYGLSPTYASYLLHGWYRREAGGPIRPRMPGRGRPRRADRRRT